MSDCQNDWDCHDPGLSWITRLRDALLTHASPLGAHLSWLGVFGPGEINPQSLLITSHPEHQNEVLDSFSYEQVAQAMNRAMEEDHAVIPWQGKVLNIASARCVIDPERCWLLGVVSDQPMHTQAMLLLVQGCVCIWNAPAKATSGRWLIDHRGRHYFSDPMSRLLAMQKSDWGTLGNSLREIVLQRWPEPGGGCHHLTLETPDSPIWVTLCCTQGSDGSPSSWYVVDYRKADSDGPPAVGAVSDARIALAIGYLSDHFAKTPSLSQAAEHVGISPFHFHRLFSAEAGVSPKQYVQRTQMQLAKVMLREAHRPIQEIARILGYASHGHFTATFSKLTGQSPSSFREAIDTV